MRKSDRVCVSKKFSQTIDEIQRRNNVEINHFKRKFTEHLVPIVRENEHKIVEQLKRVETKRPGRKKKLTWFGTTVAEWE